MLNFVWRLITDRNSVRNIFYALTFTKMVTMRNFDISDKFNVSGICVSANCAEKWLTKLCQY